MTKIQSKAHNHNANSPGLVVMGGYSWLKGCEFEFQYQIVGGKFFYKGYVVETTENNQKRLANFLKKPFKVLFN